jgi:hypothetical protein
MSQQTKAILIVGAAFLLLIVLLNAFYVVSEKNQVIITQFGEPIGNAITLPGLHLKTPFIQKANYFEKRWLEWDPDPYQRQEIHMGRYLCPLENQRSAGFFPESTRRERRAVKARRHHRRRNKKRSRQFRSHRDSSFLESRV